MGRRRTWEIPFRTERISHRVCGLSEMLDQDVRKSMDERFNLTPIQVNRIREIVKANEARISHIEAKNSVVLVVRILSSQYYCVLNLSRHGKIDLLTAFPESETVFKTFKQMIPIRSFSFASLLELHREDRVITDNDMVHFSTEQLLSLSKLIVEELAKRKTVRDFVTDKIIHSKELLRAFHNKSIGDFSKEVSFALGELGLASDENALEILGEFPLEKSEGSYLGLEESEIF